MCGTGSVLLDILFKVGVHCVVRLFIWVLRLTGHMCNRQ